MVLIRLTFIVLSTKVSQYLIFTRRMSRAVNKTSFWFAIWGINISFLALTSALSCCMVCLRRGGLSSLIPAVTRTVGIWRGNFLIRMFYYTSVNIYFNFHTLKHVISVLKQNRFSTKALNIGLFILDIRHYV